MNKRRVIITGHDLGFSKSINEGFDYVLKKLPKVFSELSILPNSKYSDDAVIIAKDSGIPCNLCFCLTNSKLISLSKSPSLTNTNGLMYNADTKNWDFSIIDKFDQKEIENEISAQYEWFLKSFGHKPSALVSQKGEHGDPKILEPIIKLAKEEKIPMRAPLWAWKANYGAQSLVESEGIKTTSNFFLALKDWRGNFGYDLETDIEKLIADVNGSEGVLEVLLFVGFCDRELLDMSSVSWQRGQLLNILKRKYFLIERLYSEFEVISFGDLMLE